jgi:magnesium-transporting ATPase (P-type)
VQVTAVGMSTEWGKLMATISEDNDEETPLQVGNGFPSPVLYSAFCCIILITYKDELLLLFMLSFCLYLWCSNADFLLSFK